MAQYNLAAYQVAFDAGGGGKQIADRLQEQGHQVCLVGFGESADAGQAYKNRRAELYDKLRQYLHPSRQEGVFALPRDGHPLRQELAVLPLQYDSDGRMILPPKDPGAASSQQGPSLRRLLGRRADRADMPADLREIYEMYDDPYEEARERWAYDPWDLDDRWDEH